MPTFPNKVDCKDWAIDAVLRNYAAIVQTLAQIAEESHDDWLKSQWTLI